MYNFWWQLPGPKSFIDRLVQDIRDGKNIIMCLPKYSPYEKLSKAVRIEMENDEWEWHLIDTQEEKDPVNLLFKRFIPNHRIDQIRNANTLAKDPVFKGKLIWLTNINQNNWLSWREFIVDYANICRHYCLLDRTLFCIPLIGELTLNLPSEDICLSLHRWCNYIDRTDMLVFTSQFFREKAIPLIEKQMIISVIVNLSLWDPFTSERLANESIDKILKPNYILKQIARERDWDNSDFVNERLLWLSGIKNEFEGKEEFHSAILSLHDPKKEIERRIWSAQVGVYFPFIEQKRQEILVKLKNVLKVPFTTRFETINNIWDLEIGHIESQIVNEISVPMELKKLVKRLRIMRNKLSHLNSLDEDILFFNYDIL